jgi:molecular chaperone GrpE
METTSTEDELEKNEQAEASTEEEVKAEASEDNAKETKEEDFKAKFYYLAAEMENLRKRQEREKQNFIKFGNEKILSQLIDVVDNLDRTLDAIRGDEDDKVKNIVVGVDMVKNQFMDILSQNGLKEVEAMGTVFDPNIHEAMAQQPAEGKEDQEVIQVFQKGYELNGRLLRAAKVIVAKND